MADDDQVIRVEMYRAISSYRAYEERRWEGASKEGNHWQVEAVKHLAALNGVALTGTVVLFATKGTTGALLVPLGLFLVAFIVLIYGMHLACVGFFQRANDYVNRMKELDNRVASNSHDPIAALEFARTNLSKASTAGEGTLGLAVRLAWVASGLFVMGAIILITLLYCGLHTH